MAELPDYPNPQGEAPEPSESALAGGPALAGETVLSDQDRDSMEAFRREHATEMLVMLFTDLVGSTALKTRLGDLAVKALDDEHRRLLLEALSDAGKAQPVKVMGDAWIFVFLKPGDAVRFALRAQAAHRQARAASHPQLAEFRVGIHLGTVVVEEGLHGPLAPGGVGDIKGLQADLTARIMSLAAGGQILCSRAVFDDARQSLKGADVEGVGSLAWRSHGLYQLKGRDEPLEICEVAEEAFIGRFPKPAGNEKAKPADTGDEAPGWRPGLEAVLPGTNWVMEARLGEGGFGEVWLARDRTLESRKTVFKFCTKKSRIRSLRRELDVFNRLVAASEGRTPPGIIEVLGAHDDAPPYYIQLAYAAGGDLRQWIAGPGRGASLRMRLDLALQMARALGGVHRAGFVHRDIKPSNYLVEPSDDPNRAPQLKLSDFGIGQEALREAVGVGQGEGRLLGGGVRYSLRSQTLAQAAGSYFFIAPELVKGSASTPGRVAQRAETAADIYSLGVSLYQLFAGDAEAVPGPGLRALDDPILREDVLACLNEEPAARPTAAELIERLEWYDARRARAEAAERDRHHRERRRARRIIVSIASLLAAAVALGLLSLSLFVRIRDSYRRERQARQNIEEEMYFSKILLAQSQVEKHEFDKARETLWSCPEVLRNVEWGYLLKQCYLDLFTLRKEGQCFVCARWSPGGRLLATGSLSGMLCLWDAGSGELLRTGVTTGSIIQIQFCHDGRRLLTAGYNGANTVWDARTARPMLVLKPEDCPKIPAALNANGERVATIAEDGVLHVWDTQTGRPVGSVLLRDPSLYDSPSAQRKAPANGAEEKVVCSMDFHPSNPALLATLCRRYSAKDGAEIETRAAVWDVERVEKRFDLKEKGAGRAMQAHTIRWSPDGEKLFVLPYSGAPRLWDAASGKEMAPLQQMKVEDYGRAAMTSDGARIAATFGHQIRLWDVATGKWLADMRGHDQNSYITSMEFRSNGKYLITTGDDATIRVWDTSDGHLLAILQGHSGTVHTAQIHPTDATLIASAAQDGTARVWKLFEFDCRVFGGRHTAALMDVSLSPNGRRVATASADGSVIVWDAESRQAAFTLRRPPKGSSICAFSPDGAKLATAFGDETIQVWDTATSKELAQTTTFTKPLRTMAWSKDGTKIATGHYDLSLRIWSASVGGELATIDTAKVFEGERLAGESPCPVSSVAFSPDGKSVVFALSSTTAYGVIWNLESNRRQCFLDAFSDAKRHSNIQSVDYSPDGAKVLAVSPEQIAVLDAMTGKELLRLREPGNPIARARFSPDGARILSECSYLGVLRLWDARTGRECLTIDSIAAYRGTGERLPGEPKYGNTGDYSPTQTALSVRRVYTSAALLQTAPWRVEDLPGGAPLSWRDRFDLWRAQQSKEQTKTANQSHPESNSQGSQSRQ